MLDQKELSTSLAHSCLKDDLITNPKNISQLRQYAIIEILRVIPLIRLQRDRINR
jgi:hypothetical protein